jgi:hypothetical protein
MLKTMQQFLGPEAAPSILEQHRPDVVVRSPVLHLLIRTHNSSISQFTASMWTPEQSDAVLSRAREINPDVKTLALPQGLQVKRGPDAVVEYIVEKLGGLIDG